MNVRKSVFLSIAVCMMIFSFSGCGTEEKSDGQTSDDTENVLDNPPAFRIATSISPFSECMFSKLGAVYKDDIGNQAKNEEELQQLFIAHGANELFVRVSTDRTKTDRGNEHSLASALEKAKIAAELGIPLNPELMLCEAYGDLGCQPAPNFQEYPEITLPGPWETLTIEQMEDVLRQYGSLVAKELLNTGVKVNVWNLGNEANFGIAGVSIQPAPGKNEEEMGTNWYQAPDTIDPGIGEMDFISMIGKPNSETIPWLKQHVWPYEARLLNAAKEGILQVDPDAVFSTHIAMPYNKELCVEFFSEMNKDGYAPDILGISVYPSENNIQANAPDDRMGTLKDTISTLYETFDKEVFIAEFAYPSTTPTGAFAGYGKADGDYTLTPEGQADYLADLTKWGIDNGLCGIRYWAPDLIIPGWLELSLFSAGADNTYIAKPALDAIYDALKEK